MTDTSIKVQYRLFVLMHLEISGWNFGCFDDFDQPVIFGRRDEAENERLEVLKPRLDETTGEEVSVYSPDEWKVFEIVAPAE